MKRALVVAIAVLLGGCTLFKSTMAPAPARTVAAQPAPAPVPGLTDGSGAPIERVPFRTGVSSATVEKMAKQQGCTGGQGAGLMTAEGPV